MPPEVFLDTAFAIALTNPNDLLFARAISIEKHFQ